METLREHTRFDVIELARQGQEFLQRLQQSQSFGDQKIRFRSWLAQTERLVKDGVDATDRIALEEGLIAFHELFSGKWMVQSSMLSTLSGMLGALNRILRSHTFKPLDVADDTFARFLRAAQLEDSQLPMGAAISVARVAKTAKLEIDVVRKCVARLVDEDLGYESPDEEEQFQIDHDRVQFALSELDRGIPRHSEYTHLDGGDAVSEISALVAQWRKTREELANSAKLGSNIVINGDQIAPVLGKLESAGLRLVRQFAPWLEEKWNRSASRRPHGACDDIDQLTGDIEVSSIVRDMRDRLPLLEAVEQEVKRKMSSAAPTSPSILIQPAYRHLEGDLKRFHDDDPFDRSVFVMMKFPDAAHMERWQLDALEHIYTAVKEELDRHGLVARRADKKTYAASRQLWDNLCIYMLGCRYGVAVLEDHVGDELNPNVALEYGFMKGLGREVVLLKEQRFKHLRADLVGTIPKEFSIGADHVVDKRSIHDAVSNWLIDIEVRPKRAR